MNKNLFYEKQSCRLCSSKNLSKVLPLKPTPIGDDYQKIFDKNIDAIDAAVLLAEAEINLSIMLSRAGLRNSSRQKLKESHAILVRKLENLSELELMSLSGAEITCYLEAENIDCDAFLCQSVERIESRTCLGY